LTACHPLTSAGAGSANAGVRRHVTLVNTGVSKKIPAFAGMTEKGAGMTDGGRNDKSEIVVKFRIMQQSNLIMNLTEQQGTDIPAFYPLNPKFSPIYL